jgi:hypothetical protein
MVLSEIVRFLFDSLIPKIVEVVCGELVASRLSNQLQEDDYSQIVETVHQKVDPCSEIDSCLPMQSWPSLSPSPAESRSLPPVREEKTMDLDSEDPPLVSDRGKTVSSLW